MYNWANRQLVYVYILRYQYCPIIVYVLCYIVREIGIYSLCFICIL